MRKLSIGLILAAALLTGCDHHKSTSQAPSEANSAAVVQNDSDVTGQSASTSSTDKPFLRALPVSSSPDNESAKPDASSNASDTSSTPPAEPASPPDMSSPGSLATSAPASASTQPSSDLPAPGNEIAQPKVVVLQTSFGRIVIELDDTAAPRTSANFRKLVSDGFYDHTTFHRVIPQFVIQGGDPNSKSDDRTKDGQGGPDYTLPAEIQLGHDRGAVAMARLPDSVNPQRESNGSQFYICIAPCPSLDDQYTVFGHVIKGMDVADKIAEQPRDKRDDPLNRIEMEASLEPKDKALEESSAANP